MSTETVNSPTPVYRPMMTDPGESLLVAHDALQFTTRWGEFARRTGIPLDAFLADPICTIPLPVYPPQWEGSRRRWVGVKPEAMWHPLLWLPDALAARNIIDLDAGDGDVTTGPEPDGLWAARVAAELMDSGLYEPETGHWLDVLALVGLDSTDADVQVRVAQWLDGADDPLLDQIDLSGYLNDDPEFFLVETGNSYGSLRRTSWAVLAQNLNRHLVEATQASSDTTMRDAVATVSYLGASLRLADGSPQPERARRLWDGAVASCEASVLERAPLTSTQLAELVTLLRTELDAVYGENRQWMEAMLDPSLDN